MSVEAYESSREGLRRSKSQMLMPKYVRFDLLRESDISMSEILRVNDEIERNQRQRMLSLSKPRQYRREMVDRIIKTTNRGFRTFAASHNKEQFY
mmetsp:Transcript_13755/g.17356  ORF Transcript_13755/g.17356 Transcript_13755/m.17356 type:complete len:95 (+) Transcript_13755:2-286(+)